MAAIPAPPAGWDCHVHVFDGAAPASAAHYQPVPRPLSEIEDLAAANGCGHLVLVQPSVYGTDNSLLLRELQRTPGRHRGVVVLAGTEAETQLAAMHAVGVRGVRFNLVSPVGSARDQARHLLFRLAPTLRTPKLARAVVRRARRTAAARTIAGRVRAGLRARPPRRPDARHGPRRGLAGARPARSRGGLDQAQGWYRLQAEAPYDALQPLIKRAATMFGERMVWGSDWPHTSFAPHPLPTYDSLWCPVIRALGEPGSQALRAGGGKLYL